jgi:DnaJ-class molecular chaperone
MVDLDDTSKCPERENCESCGGTDSVIVATMDTRIGVMCATICKYCYGEGETPELSWPETAERVGNHAEHLNITLDQMAELLQPSTGDRGLGL